jgi:tetratricopeptide (TPR) repeat protein
MDRLGLPPSRERFGILLACGQLLFALADLESAVAHLDAAADLAHEAWRPSRSERARALRTASLALITAGDLEGADRRLELASSLLGATDPELPNLQYNLAQLRWHQERPRESYALAEQCVSGAEKHGDATTTGKGYEMLALACHSLGEWKEGLDFVEKRKRAVGAALDVAQVFDVHL